MNDTWVTEDGFTWRHRAWDLDWPDRLYYGVVAWQGRLWLLGGASLSAVISLTDTVSPVS